MQGGRRRDSLAGVCSPRESLRTDDGTRAANNPAPCAGLNAWLLERATADWEEKPAEPPRRKRRAAAAQFSGTRKERRARYARSRLRLATGPAHGSVTGCEGCPLYLGAWVRIAVGRCRGFGLTVPGVAQGCGGNSGTALAARRNRASVRRRGRVERQAPRALRTTTRPRVTWARWALFRTRAAAHRGRVRLQAGYLRQQCLHDGDERRGQHLAVVVQLDGEYLNRPPGHGHEQEQFGTRP